MVSGTFDVVLGYTVVYRSSDTTWIVMRCLGDWSLGSSLLFEVDDDLHTYIELS